MELIFAEDSVKRIHQPDNFIAAMIQRMMMSVLLTMLLHNFVITMNDDAHDEIIILTATVHVTIRGTLYIMMTILKPKRLVFTNRNCTRMKNNDCITIEVCGRVWCFLVFFLFFVDCCWVDGIVCIFLLFFLCKKKEFFKVLGLTQKMSFGCIWMRIIRIWRPNSCNYNIRADVAENATLKLMTFLKCLPPLSDPCYVWGNKILFTVKFSGFLKKSWYLLIFSSFVVLRKSVLFLCRDKCIDAWSPLQTIK